MSYKTILVHCDASEFVSARLSVAVELGQRFGARLVGLHARAPFAPPVLFENAAPMDDFYRAYEDDARTERAAALDAFNEALKGAAVAHEWQAVDGFADNAIIAGARYADLVVVGQRPPATDKYTPTPSDLAETVTLSSGCAVLVVPHIGVRTAPGKTVMLCWNASRESARAASQAMPLLKAAGKVIVLIVDDKKSTPPAGGADTGVDVATWLSRHGVKATVKHDTAADTDVGSIILSRAADMGADLIVMGLYGRSRMRELILGGASRTLLGSMTVPALMAH